MTVRITLEAGKLINSLNNVAENLPKELAIVVSKTSKRAESFVAKDIQKELNTTQKAIKKQIIRTNTKKVGSNMRSLVILQKSDRMPLRDFSPNHVAAGVSYKISRTQGPKLAPSAFMGPKPGIRRPQFNGRVYKRVGGPRSKIIQLFGVSPWGVFVKNNRIDVIKKQIRQELRHQARDRIRYLELKKSGAI